MSSQTQFKDIYLEEYTDRSIVVRGETRQYKEDLKKLGGKYNSRLRGEPGWIFPKSKQNDVVKFMKEGKRLVSEEEVRAGEARTLEWESKRGGEQKISSSSSSSSINDNKVLIDMIKTLTQKIALMDKKISILMTANNIDTGSNQVSHKKVVESSSDDDSREEEEQIPRKRLLK